MSIGNSGRIVIEIDPHLKQDIYVSLRRDGITLKEWFIKQAESYLREGTQLPLEFHKSASGGGA